jgi:Mn2+/Fe2+ NRAMP family transporter
MLPEWANHAIAYLIAILICVVALIAVGGGLRRRGD